MEVALPASVDFSPFKVNSAETFQTGPHEAMSEPQGGQPDIDRTGLGVPQGRLKV